MPTVNVIIHDTTTSGWGNSSEVTGIPAEKVTALAIEKLEHGGYVIRQGYGEPGAWRGEWFACSSMKEALEWIDRAMGPSR